MKSFLILLSFGLFFTPMISSALEVGETAVCVNLKHKDKEGNYRNHCVRDPEILNRPVVLEFFSVTCSACEINLLNVHELSEKLKGKATFRMVSIDRDADQIEEYITNNQDYIPSTVAFDINREAKKAYKIIATPTMFILDSTNKVIYKHIGVLSEQDKAKIIALIGQ